MAGPVGAKTKRISKIEGTNADFKRDGYAKGGVPKSMHGSKPGKVDKPGPFGKGYSGPDVQRGSFP